MLHSLLIPVLFLHFVTSVVLKGEVRNHPENPRPMLVAYREVLLKSGKELVGKSRTDKHGRFSMQLSTVPAQKTLDFFMVAKSDTLPLGSFSGWTGGEDVLLYVRARNL